MGQIKPSGQTLGMHTQPHSVHVRTSSSLLLLAIFNALTFQLTYFMLLECSYSIRVFNTVVVSEV